MFALRSPKAERHNASGEVAPEHIRDAFRRLCDERGVERAAAALSMSRDTVLRVVAGFGVRRATVIQAAEALRQLNAEARR